MSDLLERIKQLEISLSLKDARIAQLEHDNKILNEFAEKIGVLIGAEDE